MPSTIPPGTALDRPARERLRALVALLQGAMDQMQASMLLMEEARDRRYIAARLAETREIIDGLVKIEQGRATGAWVEWAREAIPETYGSGIAFARADLALQGMASASVGAPHVHLAAAETLLTRYVTDATEIVVQLHVQAVRHTRVVLAQAGFGEQIAAGIVGGLPREATSRALKSALRRAVAETIPEGVRWSPAALTEVEINGRRYQLDTWAEMHARTEQARAVSAGMMTTTVANGVLHVQVTSHAHEPCICTPFEGRIYRLFEDRGDMRFPHVSAMPNGGPPLHPNCVHRLAPAVVEYLEERGDVEGRTKIPDGIEQMSERELAKWVRQNRNQIRRYSRQRDGIMPESFRVREGAAA